MRLDGENIYVKFAEECDAEAILKLEVSNRDFFQAFTGLRDESFYTYNEQVKRIKKAETLRKEDQDYFFVICLKESGEIIGEVHLFEVVRGNIQGCWIGYFLDKEQNGKGYMSEAVKLVVDYAFQQLKFHRIEAGVMPHNIGSIKVLLKAGFYKEGLAKKNVKINGRWEDHQTLAIINPEDEENEVHHKDEFTIEVNAPDSLNYLIFMQNVMLNAIRDNDKPVFPYVDSSKWGLLEEQEFYHKCKEIWEVVVKNIASNRRYDYDNVIMREKDLFKRLFQQNEEGDFGFQESVNMFNTWWDGFQGKIAIQSVVTDEWIEKIYEELAQSVCGERRLYIDVVYDRLSICGESKESWYAVLPIEDVYIKRKEQILSSLLACCDVTP